MRTAEERIKFAVSLATADLETLRAGDWLNLKEDLALYLHAEREIPQTLESLSGIVVSAIVPPLAQDYTRKDFLDLQEQIRKFLMPIARSASTKKPAAARVQAIKAVALKLNCAIIPAGSHAQIVASGPVRDCFLIRLFYLLGGKALGKILICSVFCGNLFYREGKIRYCSRKCSNRLAARRFASKRKQEKDPNPS